MTVVEPSVGTATNAAPDRLPVAGGQETARDLLRRCRRRPLIALSALSAAVAASACGLVAPWVLGVLVDRVDAGAGTGSDGNGQVLPLVAVMAAAAMAAGVLTWISGVLIARLGERVLADLREDVVGRAVRIPPTTLERIGMGDLLARTGDDVTLVSAAFTGLIPLVVSALFTLVLTLVGPA